MGGDATSSTQSAPARLGERRAWPDRVSSAHSGGTGAAAQLPTCPSKTMSEKVALSTEDLAKRERRAPSEGWSGIAGASPGDPREPEAIRAAAANRLRSAIADLLKSVGGARNNWTHDPGSRPGSRPGVTDPGNRTQVTPASRGQ